MELLRAMRLFSRFLRKKKTLERTQSLYHVCVSVLRSVARHASHGVFDPAFPDVVRAKLLREFLRTWNLGKHCTETRWSKQEPQ